ncbi:MAG TPA: NHL repeat-containing protein [Blastocatellia bacterium]|nr:NHL repeat-containing protein [Blastocatellia bacterium]
MRKILIAILILSLPSAVAIAVYYYATKKEPTKRDAVGQVATVAGTGHPGTEDGARQTARFSDPFGIAVDRRGNVIVADGGQSNRIKKITEKGEVQTVAGSTEGFADGPALEAQFNTPSGIAIDKDANIIIADTSNNRIRKLSAEGRVSTVAGSGISGFKDGAASGAQFDGPVGVAVDKDGNIFVADAYNDRIRKITTDGNVVTIAGAGTPGFQDGDAASALFDTPSGVAVDKDSNAFIADTGNGAIRKITPQGEVATIAKRDESTGDASVSLNRPVGIVVTHDGFLFVADAGSNRILRIAPEGTSDPYAGRSAGFADGYGLAASFNAPSGMAMDRESTLYVADAQNYLIRMIKPAAPDSTNAAEKKEPDVFIQPATVTVNTNADNVIPRLNRSTAGTGQVFPWPLNPQYQWHEVAGVVGEARGAPGGIALDHLHAGLDVRGQMGEPAVSVIDEKVSALIPAWGFDGSSEGIHLGLMSYIHIRVGRDVNNQIQLPDKFKARLDQSGKVVSIRVRRGTRFKVGDFIGTLNRLYHVHLNFGPWNAIANPIEFPFLDFKDTIAPVIEPDGIEVVSSTGTPFKQKVNNRLFISGDVDILVTAYDRVDGNVSSRKLGLYRAGYQVLKEDGSAVEGFDPAMMNIEFNRLPPDDSSVFLVYAEGSGVSAYGTPTKFKYIVTNRVRDGEARDGLLRTSALAPGNYIIRVIAEDFAGNRASGKSTELPITIQR